MFSYPFLGRASFPLRMCPDWRLFEYIWHQIYVEKLRPSGHTARSSGPLGLSAVDPVLDGAVLVDELAPDLGLGREHSRIHHLKRN